MEPILLFKSYADECETRLVNQVIERGTYWAAGPEINTFEEKMAAYFGVDHAVSFNSGTTSLYAMLLALGITDGEVIVPSFTFQATANAVVAAGATPVFADIETESFGLSAADVAAKITPKTRAIMPIHFSGDISRDIFELKALADRHDIFLLEDNAHSIGASLHGTMAGTFGHAASLSFCFNKTLTTGEGGMVLTNDEAVANAMKLLRSHGRAETQGRPYVACGFNFRMPTMAAALGIAQLEKLDFMIAQRDRMAKIYDRGLADCPGLHVSLPREGLRRVYLLYNILFEEPKQRDRYVVHLNDHKIPSRVTYRPVHQTPYFQDHFSQPDLSLPVTESVSSRILTIPLHLGMSDEQLAFVIDNTRVFFGLEPHHPTAFEVVT